MTTVQFRLIMVVCSRHFVDESSSFPLYSVNFVESLIKSTLRGEGPGQHGVLEVAAAATPVCVAGAPPPCAVWGRSPARPSTEGVRHDLQGKRTAWCASHPGLAGVGGHTARSLGCGYPRTRGDGVTESGKQR